MQDLLYEGVKQYQYYKNMSNPDGSLLYKYYLANPKVILRHC